MTAPTILELEDGQLALAADVVERNGQQAFTELARPAQPAPVAEELARPADDELRRRQGYAETIETWNAALPPVQELELEELRAIVRSGPENRLHWSARQKEAWSELVNRDEQPTELEPEPTPPADDLEEADREAEELELEEELEEEERLEKKRSSSKKPSRREYRCAYCQRKLPPERWVYSRHTGARYCTPGEGCQTPDAYARAERARARARREEAA